jgi:hypothetical protein
MIKVTNRSEGNVTYNLPELQIRRVYAPNEGKEIEEKELTALFQTDGGATLIKDHLFVRDKAWVEKYLPDAPVEYFWELADIEKCVKEDSLEMFKETLDYAPHGILELIKSYSWRLPLTDLNKIHAIKEKLGFDVQAAVTIMSAKKLSDAPVKKERLRKREEG